MSAHDTKGSSLCRALMAATVAAGLTMACEEGKPENAPASLGQAVDHQHHLTAEWITAGSLAELTDKSDLIVRGKTVEVRYDVMRNYPWNAQANREMTPEEAGGVYHDTPVTVFSFIVGDVLRSGAKTFSISAEPAAAKSTIEIVQLGGKLPDGCVATPEDTPIPSIGQEAVLFLSVAEGTRPLGARSATGRYFIVGGYQGHVVIADGVVKSPASSRHPAAFLDAHDGALAGNFVEAIRRLQ